MRMVSLKLGNQMVMAQRQGKSFIKREPVTDELWQKHLQGRDSLGIIPINDDNQCKWGCIDIDSYAGFDHKKLVNKILVYNYR